MLQFGGMDSIRAKMIRANNNNRTRAQYYHTEHHLRGYPTEPREAQVVRVDDLLKKLNDQKSRCTYCKIPIAETFVLEHILSLRQGGGHTLDNIQFTCSDCNFSKGPNRKCPDPRTMRKPITYLDMTPRDRELIDTYDKAHTDDGRSFDFSVKKIAKPEMRSEWENDGSSFVVPIRTDVALRAIEHGEYAASR